MRRGRAGFSWWCRVIVVWCACMGARPVGAQVGSGDITGVLTDQSGAAVPGATVTVTNVATNRQRVVSSTSDGAYTAASLPPGEYRLEIALSGFTPIRRDGITRRHGTEDARGFRALGRDRRRGRAGDLRRVDAPVRKRQPRGQRRPRAGRAACRSTAAPSSRSPRSRPASRCRPGRSFRASTAAGRARTSISSTASRCSSPSPGRSPSSPSSTRSRSSRSKATARRPSSGGSTAASST